MRRLCIITARGGSKGLPDKNMLMADGKPLLAYTIEAALDANVFHTIVLTTDSEEYIELLSHYPIAFHRRPDHLATDRSSSFDVIEDLLGRSTYRGHDYFVLLQPTSPLRTAHHVAEICTYFDAHYEQYDFAASVTSSHKPTVLTRPIDSDNTLKYFDIDYSRYARQNYLPEYSPNGAFFIAKPDAYLEQKHFYGPRSMAYYMDKSVSIDIDDRDDFEHFYFITQQRKRESLLLAQTRREIRLKEAYWAQEADLTLVGDAHLGQWEVDELSGRSVQNLAFTAITTAQYLELILDAGRLGRLGSTIVVSFGINDLRRGKGPVEAIAKRVEHILERLRALRPDARLYLLECPVTLFRVDCSNAEICALNQCLREIGGVRFVGLNGALQNRFGKLSPEFTDDGLNLNEAGYRRLGQLLEGAI